MTFQEAAVKTTRVTVTAVLVAAMAAGVSAQTNWPQFRGGVAGVVADDPALPERWGPDENIAWQVDIPGRAWSSPIVWGDHVFVLTVTRVSGTTDAQPMPIESYRARSLGGSMTGADIEREGEPLRWMLYDVDFETG
ncbi:MAG: PQQ-binding-like beta-propeller repeat protein, partial [Acidobacteria bacterium]|nr:PQQ-binding-like beta-propeller repeat protein [Acidobacteriota bacterium]